MKKLIAGSLLGIIAAAFIPSAVQAYEAWFEQYDHNHDGHWTYKEFRNAHMNWIKHHPGEARIKEAELRHQWDTWDPNHRGWVEESQVREYHHW